MSTDRLEYSLMGLLVKTLRWLAAGLGNRSLRVADEVGLPYREIERLKSENAILRKRLSGTRCSCHTWQERLHILRHMEVFSLPSRKVAHVFGIARSTYYRWLREAAAGTLAGKRSGGKSPPNGTGDEAVALVWRIFDANPFLGREKTAQMIQRLDLFLSWEWFHDPFLCQGVAFVAILHYIHGPQVNTDGTSREIGDRRDMGADGAVASGTATAPERWSALSGLPGSG